MAPMSAEPDRDGLLHQLLTETDESATAALFVQLCRESPALRHWLWEDFARDEQTRARFAARLKQPDAPVPPRVAELATEDTGRAAELAHLRQQVSARIYGGRTWAEIESIIVQLRAGRADLAAFLLALEWQRAGNRAPRSAPLMRAGAAFLDAVLRGHGRSRIAQLGSAAEIVRTGAESKTRRASVGYGDWWKLQLLLHILRHPRPSYRTRELHAHLLTLGLRVDPREIRRFCIRHGIARDMRGGRPRATPGVVRAGATRTRAPGARRTRPA